MTARELEDELSRLPRLLYYYNRNGLYYTPVILGRNENGPLEAWTSIPSTLEHKIEIMHELYEKSELSEDEKRIFVDCYCRISNWCKRLQRSAREQLHFLEELDDKQLKDISKQVKMYQCARSLYNSYSR